MMTHNPTTRSNLITDPHAIRAAKRDLMRGALKVKPAWLVGDKHSRFPLVLPDLRGRNDVRDLLRVHSSEGKAEVTACWRVAMGDQGQ